MYAKKFRKNPVFGGDKKKGVEIKVEMKVGGTYLINYREFISTLKF